MKKITALLITVLLAFTLCVPAFAATGGFVNSPSAYDGSTLISATHTDPSWDGNVVITPYLYRDRLGAQRNANIKQAYNEIKNNADLTKLVPELKNVATVPVSDLAVSELFYAHDEGVDAGKTYNGTYTITLDCETLKNFQALICFVNGEWKIVNSAKVENGYLVFNADAIDCAYAIVLSTDSRTPNTGDSNTVYICLAVVLLAAGAIAVCVLPKKKTSKV